MIIIGDIHGCYKTLLSLLEKLPKGEKICLVGYLGDRGPLSKEVFSYVIEHKIDCVVGNHEDMMLRPDHLWFKNGGTTTIKEYENSPELLLAHQEWIKSLTTYIKYPEIKNKEGRYLIVSHSGITSLDLDEISKSGNIYWNRSTPISNPEWFNVFGHTVVKEPLIHQDFADIDTGCFYKAAGFGVLTALQFPEMVIFQQENIDEMLPT